MSNIYPQTYPTPIQAFLPARSAPVQTWPQHSYPSAPHNTMLTRPLNAPKSKLSEFIGRFSPSQLASYTVNVVVGIALIWALFFRKRLR